MRTRANRRGTVTISSRVVVTEHLVNGDILLKAVQRAVAVVKEELEHLYTFI